MILLIQLRFQCLDSLLLLENIERQFLYLLQQLLLIICNFLTSHAAITHAVL